MEPMKDKEAKTCNAAIEKVFNRLGIPKSIYCDEGSEFTNKSFLQILEKHKIEIIYATNHAPFLESFNRTIKRMMTNYMEATKNSSWAAVYRDVLNAYNDTKHSTTKFAPNDIQTEDIEAVRKKIKARGRTKNYDDISDGDTVKNTAIVSDDIRRHRIPCIQFMNRIQHLLPVENNNTTTQTTTTTTTTSTTSSDMISTDDTRKEEEDLICGADTFNDHWIQEFY
jgi:hypothetical protein